MLYIVYIYSVANYIFHGFNSILQMWNFASNEKIDFRDMKNISHLIDMLEKRTFIHKNILQFGLHDIHDMRSVVFLSPSHVNCSRYFVCCSAITQKQVQLCIGQLNISLLFYDILWSWLKMIFASLAKYNFTFAKFYLFNQNLI